VPREGGIERSFWDSQLLGQEIWLSAVRQSSWSKYVSHKSIDYLPLVCCMSRILQTRKTTKMKIIKKKRKENIRFLHTKICFSVPS
jgi:hypothetical protein